MADSILNAIEKISGEKILRTEETPKKENISESLELKEIEEAKKIIAEKKLTPHKKRNLKDLMRQFKSIAERKAKAEKQGIQVYPSTLKKLEKAHKKLNKEIERIKEIKPKEELKPKIKLGKKLPDEEAEEIKKKLEPKLNDEETLKKKEKPIIEAKEIKEEEIEEGEEVKFDSTWLIYGLVGLVAIFILMQVFKKSSSPTPPSIPKTKSKIRQFDIGGGRIIEIPV